MGHFGVNFKGGPACDIDTMMLRAAPVLLRVVRNDHKQDKWDALDKPLDAPLAHEVVYVYVLQSIPRSVHFRASVKAMNGTFATGDYLYWPDAIRTPHPHDADIRTPDAWAAFKARVKADVLSKLPADLMGYLREVGAQRRADRNQK